MSLSKAGIPLVILTLTMIGGIKSPAVAGSGQLNIDTSEGYRSGDVQIEPWLGAWYTWVSYQGVQMIFLALHSQVYNSPVFSFVAQAYNTSAGSRIFVGSLLLMMEAYNDTDGNGILDANYTAGTTELKYDLIMNSSLTFDATPVSWTVQNNVTHYRWGIKYGGVDLALDNPSAQSYSDVAIASKVMLDYVSFSYDYSMTQNTTSLKTNFGIGNITIIPPSSLSYATLKGLSLDLLYSTVVVSPRQYQILAGNTVINSTQTGNPTIPLDLAQLKVANVTAYKFLFGKSYTLFQGGPSTHSASSIAVPRDSVPLNLFATSWFSSLNTLQYYVGNSLPVIGNLPSQSDLRYNSSRFLYRISYPQWSGYALQHDPTYIAYYVPIPSMLPLPAIAFIAGIGIIVLAISVRGLRRLRRERAALGSGLGRTVAGGVT